MVHIPEEAALEAQQLFHTPIAKIRLSHSEELNQSLHEALLRWRDRNLDKPKHVDAWDVVRGWEIGPDFFAQLHDEPAVSGLRQLIEQCFLSFVNEHHLALDFTPARAADSCDIPASWASVLYENAFLADEHIHHGAHFVAVYYVKVPAEIDGRDNHAGYLLMRDPRPGMHTIRLGGQKTVELVRPEEGLLVLMPAYVSHGVRPFRGTGERISINCNINIQGMRLRDANANGE